MTDKLQRLHTADNAQKTNSSKEASSAKMTNIAVMAIPLALYIHIPWCVKKCPYCDFNSHELPTDSPLSMSETYEDYVDALLADALLQQPLAQGRKLSSIFIGGGTPSLLPIPQYQRLFKGLRHYFDFADDIEITMEANPGTLEHAPFTEYLQVGINRLSIGVQSFSADKLTTLGRIHDPQQAVTAIKAAREVEGFYEPHLEDSSAPLEVQYQPVHDVIIQPDGRLQTFGDKWHVNSLHKQAINKVGEGLFVEALAPDGLVEAISLLEHPFMIGVQWHPELNYAQDNLSKFLFTEFIHYASQTQAQ